MSRAAATGSGCPGDRVATEKPCGRPEPRAETTKWDHSPARAHGTKWACSRSPELCSLVPYFGEERARRAFWSLVFSLSCRHDTPSSEVRSLVPVPPKPARGLAKVWTPCCAFLGLRVSARPRLLAAAAPGIPRPPVLGRVMAPGEERGVPEDGPFPHWRENSQQQQQHGGFCWIEGTSFSL